MQRSPGFADLVTFSLWLGLAVLTACGAGGGGGPVGGNPPPPPNPQEPPTPIDFGMYPGLSAEPGPQEGQVVLRFKAPPASPGAVTAYEVRAQIRHLDASNLLDAPIVPQAHAPQSPGTAEALLLTGLEGGQTLQFALRAHHGASRGPFSCPVASRVSGGAPAPPPTNAIAISQPATLNQDGAYYRLTADITCPGTAFRITARDVTLDLGGRTVTYGTQPGSSPAIYSEYLYASGRTRILNGTLRQGAGNGNAPGVEFRGGHDIEMSHLDITVQGADSDALRVWDNPSGNLRVHHCTLRCDTTVVTDRHFPGVAALWLGGITGACQVDHNRVLSSPQWGMKIEGTASNGPFDIHHNLITGTRSRVANAYMLGVHKPDAFVFENLLSGESRGIHLDGEYHSGRNARVHDNRIQGQDFPNAEYPQHWCHGIKVEVSPNTRIWHNRVHVIADAQHAAAYALDVGLGPASNTIIDRNLFLATSNTPLFEARALNWTYGAEPGPNVLTCLLNVFRGTNRLIYRDWPPAVGGALTGCAFARETTPGASATFSFEHFETSDQGNNKGHRFIDPLTLLDATLVTQWPNAGPFETSREHTLTVHVHDGVGAAVVGAQVRVRDKDGAQVATATTQEDGSASALLVAHRVRNGPTVDARGPFQVSVDGAAKGTWAGAVDVLNRRALHVILGAPSSATADETAPAAPTQVQALPASASRVVAWWQPPSDPSGISAYLIYVDDELLAVRATPEVVLSGLDANREFRVEIEAVDGGGQRSVRSTAVLVRTRVEDRGP